MGFDNKYPYTDFHELNLDWILEQMKNLATAWDEYKEQLTGENGEWPTFKSYIETEWQNYQEALTGPNGTWPTFKATMEQAWLDYQNNLTGVGGEWPTFKATMEGEWQAFFDNYLQTLGVVQTTGTSQTDVMSQDASTKAFLKSENKSRTMFVGNIYEPLNLIDGEYCDRASGTIGYNNAYARTDYIEVTPNTAYVIGNLRHGAWFDSNKVYISGLGDYSNVRTTETSPANAAYIIMNLNKTERAALSAYIVPQTYENAEAYFPGVKIPVLSTRGYDSTKPMSQSAVTYYLDNMDQRDASLEYENEIDRRNLNKLLDTNNLLINAELHTDQYYDSSPGTNPTYKYFVIDVTNGVTYKIKTSNDIRFISKEGQNLYTYAGSDFTYTADFTGKLYITFFTNSESSVYISTVTEDVGTFEKPALNPNLVKQTPENSETTLLSQKGLINYYVKKGSIYGKGFYTSSGSLNDGESLDLPVVNLKTYSVIAFECKISSFTALRISRGITEYSSTYLDIDATNITITRYITSPDSETYAHGLTISDYIKVYIIQNDNRKVKIVISTDSGTYVKDDISWYGDANAQTLATSVGSSLTDCKLTFSNKMIRNSLWLFGDSYLNFANDERWLYYAYDDGFKNYLINSYPGESSPSAITALNNLLNAGQPGVCLWGLGMNDGTDTDASTPSATWMTYINQFIAACIEKGIEPVLATIPTVPTVLNEGKNNWVRNSGYRYVDFAKAVGAQSDGTWYTGCISSDNIHPSSKGARLLYEQALVDLPELTY